MLIACAIRYFKTRRIVNSTIIGMYAIFFTSLALWDTYTFSFVSLLTHCHSALLSAVTMSCIPNIRLFLYLSASTCGACLLHWSPKVRRLHCFPLVTTGQRLALRWFVFNDSLILDHQLLQHWYKIVSTGNGEHLAEPRIVIKLSSEYAHY